MIKFENFSSYIPVSDESIPLIKLGISFLRTSDGSDWYDIQKLFSDDTVKVVYDKNNVIVSFSDDVSTLFPDGQSIVELRKADVPKDLDVSGGWVFNNNEIVKREYSEDEKISSAELMRTNLITFARETMNEWQNDLLLGTISAQDKESLAVWNQYVKELKAMDFSAGGEFNFPVQPSEIAIS